MTEGPLQAFVQHFKFTPILEPNSTIKTIEQTMVDLAITLAETNIRQKEEELAETTVHTLACAVLEEVQQLRNHRNYIAGLARHAGFQASE